MTFFLIPKFPDTGSYTKWTNSWYRYLHGTGTHKKSSKFLNFVDKNQFQYKKIPIPAARLFPVPTFFDTVSEIFPVQNLSDIDSETFSRYKIGPIPIPRLFPLPICSDKGSDTTTFLGMSVQVCHTLHLSIVSTQFILFVPLDLNLSSNFSSNSFRLIAVSIVSIQSILVVPSPLQI